MEGSFVFFGSGGSLGVPIIGCSCPTCASSSPFDKRLRPSGLLKVGQKQFLIDAGPDLRQQALRDHLTHIDGFFLTHAHYDHVAGLDDLRVFHYIQQRRIPCLLSQETLEEVKTRFYYLFKEGEGIHYQFLPIAENEGAVELEGVSVRYFTYFQAEMKVTGYRIGDFAYVSDIRQYSEDIFESLKGVRVLVLSALRPVPSAVHFSLDEAIAFARKTGAEQTFFTHIAHELKHDETNAKLPAGFQLSYDGLEIKSLSLN